jgi:phosphoglycolate phosphatase-like HAD superfamily hydrolase
MRLLGLSPYIETLVTGSEHRAEKTEAIRDVLQAWDVTPEEAAYVGDTAYDMRASREAGVLALGAAWTDTATLRESDGAARLFSSVRELQDWLDETAG